MMFSPRHSRKAPSSPPLIAPSSSPHIWHFQVNVFSSASNLFFHSHRSNAVCASNIYVVCRRPNERRKRKKKLPRNNTKVPQKMKTNSSDLFAFLKIWFLNKPLNSCDKKNPPYFADTLSGKWQTAKCSAGCVHGMRAFHLLSSYPDPSPSHPLPPHCPPPMCLANGPAWRQTEKHLG